MKKILFGIAFLAGLVSCSKDEPTNGGENTENGKYELYLHYKADYSSEDVNSVMPLGLQFTVNAPNKDGKFSTIYTKDKDGKLVEWTSELEGFGTYTNHYDIPDKDTCIYLCTEDNVIDFNANIIVTSSSSEEYGFSYKSELSKGGEMLYKAEEKNLKMSLGNVIHRELNKK